MALSSAAFPNFLRISGLLGARRTGSGETTPPQARLWKLPGGTVWKTIFVTIAVLLVVQ
jgi:hypothetical protein